LLCAPPRTKPTPLGNWQWFLGRWTIGFIKSRHGHRPRSASARGIRPPSPLRDPIQPVALLQSSHSWRANRVIPTRSTCAVCLLIRAAATWEGPLFAYPAKASQPNNTIAEYHDHLGAPLYDSARGGWPPPPCYEGGQLTAPSATRCMDQPARGTVDPRSARRPQNYLTRVARRARVLSRRRRPRARTMVSTRVESLASCLYELEAA